MKQKILLWAFFLFRNVGNAAGLKACIWHESTNECILNIARRMNESEWAFFYVDNTVSTKARIRRDFTLLSCCSFRYLQ